ncbi:MAG: DUF1587 domain-containing protein, partial [Planctomycetes bacterium]|nr:DUF1587 domain-containing protein [Planctomycetota bacterium]
MSRKIGFRLLLSIFAVSLIGVGLWSCLPSSFERNVEAAEDTPKNDAPKSETLEQRYATKVQPFVQRHCIGCHGAKKQEASLDLSRDTTVAAIVKNFGHWELALDRIQSKEMPPAEAASQPKPEERAAVVEWLRDLRTREADKNAGDPGTVLARRLSNAEFDNTIRDLTGVDIRPTKEFPVDPANQAGFDNSGESLAMSPALLKKYLAAARLVADYVVLKPEGFVFASHPVVTDTDRDKYCVRRILDFYSRHSIDLADYFLAAWKYRHRAKLGLGDADLKRLATDAGLSAKYLTLIWSALNEAESDTGPLAAIRKKWDEIPVPSKTTDTGKPGCDRLRDLVGRMRKQIKVPAPKVGVNGISDGSQPFLLWRNRQQAAKHRSYAGDVVADLPKLSNELKEPDYIRYFAVENTAEAKEKARAAVDRFCSVFPDAYFITDRSSNSSATDGKGRPLTAGFHLMQGYFRDDAPLCELVLDDKQKLELDALWFELNFITLVPMRQYKDFIFFERAEPPRYMAEAEFDFARSEDKDATSEAKMTRL